ncbi:uncharacterized protein [Diadema setosum]|uniref:uncharacterized protein isoform X1 n=1 Tax=Diadema setosum TaxID=31175 RepID=UPI003B3A6D72
MPKPVKRSGKGPKREHAPRTEQDRASSGSGRAKGRGAVAENKCVRIAAVMFLPVLFGVFGLIMFPPSLNSGESNVTNASGSRGNNRTIVEQVVPNSGQSGPSPAESASIGGEGERKARSVKSKSDSAGQSQNKQTNKSQKQKKKEKGSSKTADDQTSLQKEKLDKVTTDFQPSYLEHLDIHQVVVEGRTIVPTELTKDKPNSPVKVYQYEGFLSDRECAGLMKVHQQHVSDLSAVDPLICFDGIDTLRKHLKDANRDISVSLKDFTEGTTCLNSSFSSQLKSFLTWSYSTAFYPGESKFSTIFEERVFQATGLSPTNGGKFQITSYPQGIGYKTHTDCILDNADKRDRFATILVYLQDVKEGGETQFPELGVSVKPKRGRAVVWNNMDATGYCEPQSVHKAAAVINGHKFILQRWYYHESFFQLGKRPPQADIPAREPGQAKVNCDEYEHGSCRWYDEWNYDHIIDYQLKKSSLH